MTRIFLLIVLASSLLFELFLTIRTFVDPSWLPGSFGVEPSPGVMTLNHIVAWLLLLVSWLIIADLVYVIKRRREAIALSFTLGLWWVGMGIAIWCVSGQPTNLFTDSLKGLLLVILTISFSRSAKLA